MLLLNNILCKLIDVPIEIAKHPLPCTRFYRLIVRLVSSGDCLSYDGSVDLTNVNNPITPTTKYGEIVLNFATQVHLDGSGKDFYLVVAPGTHLAGQLQLEVTLEGGAVCTVPLPPVVFKPNTTYRRDVVLPVDDFMFPDSFSVTPSSLSCRAGEALAFALSGSVDVLDFWSGESGHEWDNRNAGETFYADMTLSFRTHVQAGGQPTPLKLKYSHDYNNGGTEEDILNTTWTDISSRFTFDTDNSSDSTPADTENFVDSGEINVNDAFPEEGGVFFAFFYHIDAYDASLGNGRTQAFVNEFTVKSTLNGTAEEVFVQSSTSPVAIPGASYDSDSSKPGWFAKLNSLRFTSAFKPTTDRDAYAVIPMQTRKSFVKSADTAFALVEKGGDVPSTWSYTFTDPGTYKVVFAGIRNTFRGEIEYVETFTINVE